MKPSAKNVNVSIPPARILCTKRETVSDSVSNMDEETLPDLPDSSSDNNNSSKNNIHLHYIKTEMACTSTGLSKSDEYISTPTSRYSKNRNRLKLKRMNRNKKENDNEECVFTGVDEGEEVQFIPITDVTRRYVEIQFGLVDSDIVNMPNYVIGGYGRGVRPPRYVYMIGGDGNCFFRAISFISSGSEDRHL